MILVNGGNLMDEEEFLEILKKENPEGCLGLDCEDCMFEKHRMESNLSSMICKVLRQTRS